MESCDVLIVGGGPAGSTLAWGLRDSGLKVVIVDKAGFPRDKVCAGWITPSIVDALKLDLQAYADGRVLQAISGFNLGMLGGGQKTIVYDGEPVSYGIRRCEFDHYLLSRCGVEVKNRYPLKSIKRLNGYWNINDEINTPLLIGAGGHFCPVARYLGANPGLSEITVAAQETEFRMTAEQQSACPVDATVPELYFCEDLKGYGWIFRKGEYLNIGLGREDQHGLGRHVEEFCRYLESIGRIAGTNSGKFKGHAYVLYDHAQRRMVDDGILLVGDAAGFAHTRSGEGIRPAIESALIAADVIKAVNASYTAANLQNYTRLIEQSFGRRQAASFTDYLPGPIKHIVSGSLLTNQLFLRHIVMDRWFLQRNRQPVARPHKECAA